MKLLDSVIVKRTAGHFEAGWYLYSDLDSISPYSAPEIDYRVAVIKPLTDDLDGPRLAKHVRLSELFDWQEYSLALNA